ncbi:MAG: hypothetical protein CME06_00395 [Gemmatimonadetes bacterium]|nr:hypothetical protein [Gemmatimonadota bacterium]
MLIDGTLIGCGESAKGAGRTGRKKKVRLKEGLRVGEEIPPWVCAQMCLRSGRSVSSETGGVAALL